MPDHDSTAAEHQARVQAAGSPGAAVNAIGAWLHDEFDGFYARFAAIPRQAQEAFEQRDHPRSIALSATRLSLYNDAINRLGEQLKHACPAVADDSGIWDAIEADYMPRVGKRYEADIGIAFFHSTRRKVYQGEWKPVEYSFGSVAAEEALWARLLHVIPGAGQLSGAAAAEILSVPALRVPFEAREADAAALAERVNRVLGEHGSPAFRRIEMVNAGFYRNRGAYLVGRVVCADGSLLPLIVALVNGERGVAVDAVLMNEADAHNLFSSTLANFHVTNPSYHELCQFLYSIMPMRPLGLHYSTIGYNHLGKVAVMKDLEAELIAGGLVFETSIGFKGTVAIGFAAPGSAYNLKVIRDHPTAQYKWGEFEGIESVLKKYSRVHDINRTGSMLDNIIYYNLKLDKAWFDPALLAELLEAAGETVFLQGEAVIFKYLIVQRRLTPLPEFLQGASAEDAHTVIVNLGYCIKNNAAANIFNKDLDARNYGVSRYLKVYLFDYDALEDFVGVTIATNAERFDGEEDVPDWFFADGYVFLPEEIEVGLRLPERSQRRVLREVHGDLYTTEYWLRIQRSLQAGEVPSLRVYPEDSKLERGADAGMALT